MEKYAILIKPSMNKVFFEAAKKLMICEIQILDQMVLKKGLVNFEITSIGGVDYLTFNSKISIKPEDICYISRLSSMYCLFKIVKDNFENIFLQPLNVKGSTYFSEDIISIQKYSGKTNEEFTKLMMNIALFCSDYAEKAFSKEKVGSLAILDPVAGRGTTLFQGLIYGFNVYGIEADKKAAHSFMTFFKRYLTTKHYKHKFNQNKIGRNGKKVGNRFEFIFALPAWIDLLKCGGVIAVSWNIRILPREELEEVFSKEGLIILHSPALDKLTHVVDASITRDILIAKKMIN